MEVAQFADIQEAFLVRVSQIVYCTMATIDRKNRPRSRIIHPIWEGSTGWLITSPTSHKLKHLAHNPAVSLAYMPTLDTPVYVDAFAEWITSVEEKQRIWQLHQTTQPPIGFDPEPHYGSIDHPHYGILRFTPWRVELGNLYGESLIWRPTERANGSD